MYKVISSNYSSVSFDPLAVEDSGVLVTGIQIPKKLTDFCKSIMGNLDRDPVSSMFDYKQEIATIVTQLGVPGLEISEKSIIALNRMSGDSRGLMFHHDCDGIDPVAILVLCLHRDESLEGGFFQYIDSCYQNNLQRHPNTEIYTVPKDAIVQDNVHSLCLKKGQAVLFNDAKVLHAVSDTSGSGHRLHLIVFLENGKTSN